MNKRRLVLTRILEVSRSCGTAPALQLTRSAFEAGLLDSFELPEILLAFRTGDLSGFVERATTPPCLAPAEVCAA